MAVNDGGSAFPLYQDAEYDSGAHALEMIDPGMSLRDWLAGRGPGNLEEHFTTFGDLCDATGIDGTRHSSMHSFEKMCQRNAILRYKWADAMLLAREASQ